MPGRELPDEYYERCRCGHERRDHHRGVSRVFRMNSTVEWTYCRRNGCDCKTFVHGLTETDLEVFTEALRTPAPELEDDEGQEAA